MVAAVYEHLARSLSAIVAVTLEDALGVEERPNLPGTSGAQAPNWCRPLPFTLEQVVAHEGPRRIAGIMRDAGRSRRR